MATISLSKFCKQHNLPKTSVHSWLKIEGFDTSEGLTDDAQIAAAQQFGVTEAPQFSPEPFPNASSDGALDHYSVGGGMEVLNPGRLALASEETRLTTRLERRTAVAQSFQSIALTREERRAMIAQAAIADADDDAEVYASAYQQRLDGNLQRHAMAGAVVLGKDIEGES